MNIVKNSPCNTILIVEDEKGIQDVLKLALEMDGYQVFTANNGKEGIEVLSRIPTPCLILLDLMMPVMNGWEFADALAKDASLAPIPIVVVSAFADNSKTFPTKAIIKKPLDMDVLFQLVEELCEPSPLENV